MPALTTESPDTLQNLCLNYIASEIVHPAASDGEYCHKNTNDSIVLQKSIGRPDGTFMPSVVADLLISRMSTCRTLCNETIELFQSSNTCLRHVVIRQAPITAAGLRVLRSHKLVSLVVEPDDPKRLTVTDVICCLNEWTVANLRSLSVTGVTFGQARGPPVIISVCALRNLHSLDVSRTDFNESMLKIIVNDLPRLESLDISSTLVSDVTALSQCRTRLRRLLMYNVRLNNSSSVDVLRSLSSLRVLDVSQDPPSHSYSSLRVNSITANDILLEGSEFHDLVSLDISGTQNVVATLVRYQNVIHVGYVLDSIKLWCIVKFVVGDIYAEKVLKFTIFSMTAETEYSSYIDHHF